MVPVDVVEAVKFKVAPLQIGLLLDADGAGGGLGSASTTGPAGAEGQPFNIAMIFV